ncbi:MAG TPA: VWA domain-containing protein [Candidatus Choladousia intestinavium]|uniref:VWA domain-containing protein n=1 Tax=Candidatus Choladousia intestinavium TaxID=2840727 RepID=A0A9D1AC14_9FIRM|nr:VWA domain-containing protein [Candidatus Choladousia intestinavium]
MGITNSNKQIDASQIDCNGTFKVTLALSAAPDISSNPTDIVLVLDRSGSMAGSPLANMKTGAKTFIDIIDEATDSTQDGTIGSGSRIGIVSFSDTAAADTQLITSVSALKDSVDSLTAGGSTNHADAFSKAVSLFDPASSNAKVIVMFTDGKTTSGPQPSPVAAAARAAGIIIYCIGLMGADGIDVTVLNDWATDPDASHVAVTPNDSDLENLFADLAANISKPGATDIVIDEILNTDFNIVSITPPTKGSAMTVNATTIRWEIPSLGVMGNEGASLEFLVRHAGNTSGTKLINHSILYTDTEGNSVTFPSPSIKVDCGLAVTPEPCPTPVNLSVGNCQDALVMDLGDTYLESLGRILQLNVTIKNVCPNKRVALGVILTETDASGQEHPRGLKAFTIPPHTSSRCRDILVKCIKFVLPEDLNVSGCADRSICGTRNFKVRLIAHNIDTDFTCCDSILTL